MLSGDILIRSPLSVALLPPPSLVELCRTMAAIVTLSNQQNIDDDIDDIYLENGLLSYENPNYHMDPQRIEQNSHLYEEILSELQQQNIPVRNNLPHLVSNRKDYARLDITSMGVDLKENFIATADKKSLDEPSEIKNKEKELLEMNDVNNDNKRKTAFNESNECNFHVPHKHENYETINTDNATDEIDEENKKEFGKENIENIEDKDRNTDLPMGWEKHEDNDGPYYWHIKSGTIQREPPLWTKDAPHELKTPIIPSNSHQFLSHLSEVNQTQSSSSKYKEESKNSVSVIRSNTSSALDLEDERRRKDELAFKRRSYPLKLESESPIRFAVRSLGWVEIAEEDLTPEKSSKAVNKCIVDLSLGRNDLLDVVGRWGDGKDLFMDLDEGALKLIDPENLTILNTQPIHTIRVWGVGRDNGRDFAYVARDRLTRIHMCHVFRCDTAARIIANTLRDICKKIMIERSLQLECNGSMSTASRGAIRPTDLPTENRRWIRHPQSFPTPMEEPKKVLKAQYVGSLEIFNSTGIDALNSAIDSVIDGSQHKQWEHVNVSVAPSMISINSVGDDPRLIVECRVRYLSFLGIGKNVKTCAFIMHTAQDKFVAHVFYCEPSSGALCKTIEAACKLRYQKCLDAHPETRDSNDSNTPSKGLGATIKSLMHTFTIKKDKSNSS